MNDNEMNEWQLLDPEGNSFLTIKKNGLRLLKK